MHKLLQRQLKRYVKADGSDHLPEPWNMLVSAVNEAYEQADGDRRLLERSLELMSQELIQRNAELVRSNGELQQFAYVASHDLQEPLRMVASYLQLLERRYKDQLDADASQFIAFAVEGIRRMYTLINDLLEYSQIEARGRVFKPTDCSVVVSRVVEVLRPEIEQAGATVSHNGLPVVTGDAAQLTEIFEQLINNAIKFRGERPPIVQIWAERKKDEWLFAVRDNGVGIALQYMQRVFIIFQRLHVREQYPGNGIGLAICKKIVERHAGQIWVESTLGQGSTFYFTLPIVASSVGEEGVG